MYILLDIGGTNTRIAVSSDGALIAKSVTIPTEQDFNLAVDSIAKQVRQNFGDAPITAISVGLAGVLNTSKTELFFSANLPNWVGQPISKKLEETFNCSVILENDAALGALGEATFGAGKNYTSVTYITIGTGIGGAWVLNGVLQQGLFNSEVGHQILDLNQNLDWEKLVINEDDPEKQIEYLARGLFNNQLHWPSQIIILGGGVALGKRWPLEKIMDLLSLDMKIYPEVPKLAYAELGDATGLHGALKLISNKKT